MIGDGQGNVLPGKNITPNEAYTMVVRALGVNENASVIKNSKWPANYASLAKQWGITKDVTGSPLDRANTAQVIYNALSADIYVTNTDGTMEEASNLGLDANLFAGYGVDTSVDPQEIYVTNAVAEAAKDSCPELANYVGQYVTVLYGFNGGQVNSNIVLAAPVDVNVSTKTITGTFRATKTATTNPSTSAAAFFFIADNGDAYTFKNVSGSTALNATVTSQTGIYINGATVNTGNLDTLVSSQNSVEIVVEMANESDVVIASIKSISDWNVTRYVSASADAKDTDTNFAGYTLPTNAVTGTVDNSKLIVDGAVSNYADIKSGDIVTIYEGALTPPMITKLSVSRDTISGKAERVNANGTVRIAGKDYVWVDTVLGMAPTQVPTTDRNVDVTLNLTSDGKYYNYEYTAGASRQYAIVASNYTHASPNTLELVDQAGELKTYRFDDMPSTVVGMPGTLTAGDIVMYEVAEDNARSVTAVIPQNSSTVTGSYNGTTYAAKAFASDAKVMFNLGAPDSYDASTSNKLVTGKSFAATYVLNGGQIAFMYTSCEYSTDTVEGYAVINGSVANDYADGFFNGQAISVNLVGTAASGPFIYEALLYKNGTLLNATAATPAASLMAPITPAANGDTYTFTVGGTNIDFSASGYIYIHDGSDWSVLTPGDITSSYPAAGTMRFYGDEVPYGCATII